MRDVNRFLEDVKWFWLIREMEVASPAPMEGAGHRPHYAETDEAGNRNWLSVCIQLYCTNPNTQKPCPSLIGHLKFIHCSGKLTWRAWKRPQWYLLGGETGAGGGGRHWKLQPAVPVLTPRPTDGPAVACTPWHKVADNGGGGRRKWKPQNPDILREEICIIKMGCFS